MANIKIKAAGAATLALMLVALGACSGKGEDPVAEETAKPTNGPIGKYDPPIVLTTGREISETLKFEEGRSIDNNVWYDAYRDALGVEVKNDWVVKGGEAYTNKSNIAIASGEIPDVLAVNALQLRNLVEADLISNWSSMSSPSSNTAFISTLTLLSSRSSTNTSPTNPLHSESRSG